MNERNTMLLPSDYKSEDFEIKTASSGSQFLSLEDGQTQTIRILGNENIPETFVMGYQSWNQKEKMNRPNTDRGYSEALEHAEIKTVKDKHGNEVERKDVRGFWLTQIYNVTEKRAQVWEITQKYLREELELLEKNPKWGDLTQYDITITRTGKDMNNTKYSLTPDPDKAPPSEEMLKAIKEARIDCSAVFKTDSAGKHLYPMGALTEDAPAVNDVPNDQSNIDRLRSIISED